MPTGAATTTVRVTGMSDLSDLIRHSLRFAVWAAGEGICASEDDPEEFLLAYSSATDDTDWDTLADGVSGKVESMPEVLAALSALVYGFESYENVDPLLADARAALTKAGVEWRRAPASSEPPKKTFDAWWEHKE